MLVSEDLQDHFPQVLELKLEVLAAESVVEKLLEAVSVNFNEDFNEGVETIFEEVFGKVLL